jgi:type VI secretion system protein ImpF
MADLTPQERLQPCLLDRLTDEEPTQRAESRDKRVVSLQRYRQAVLRDLSWLLSTASHAPGEDIRDFKEVETSVINYGIRDVKGMTMAGMSVGELEKELTRTVKAFEPRILADTLQVKAVVDEEAYGHHALEFAVKGQLWANPIPEALYLKTSVDIDTGGFSAPRSGG